MGAAHGPRANGDGPPAPVRAAHRAVPRAGWRRHEVVLLVAGDAVAIGVATLLAKMWSFGLESAQLQIRSVTVPYIALAGAIVPTWLAVLAMTGAYDVGPFGTTPGQYGRVVRAGANFVAIVAVAYFILHLEKLTRGFLAATVPLAVVLTLGVRAGAGFRLRRLRARGQAVRRAVVVGSRRSVADVVRHLAGHPGSGLDAIGACVPGPVEPMMTRGITVPVLGGTDAVLDAVERSGADVVIFTGSLALGRVRTLAWKVEGSGIDVFVVPTLAQQAAELDVRPVGGLPLVYVDRLPDLAPGPIGPPEPPTPPRGQNLDLVPLDPRRPIESSATPTPARRP